MRFLLKDVLIQRFVAGGGLGAVKLATGLVRVKILAVILGAAGIGVLAQAAQFTLVAIALTSVSMAVGIINRTRSEAIRANSSAQRLTLGTALISLFVLIVLYLLLAISNRLTVATLVFRGTLSEAQLFPIILGVPFAVIASGYIEGLFYSRDRFDLYVKAGAVASLADLVLYSCGAWLGGVVGATVAVGVSSVALLASYLFFLRRIGEEWSTLFPLNFHWREALALLRYGAVMLCTAALGYLSVLYVRAEILGQYGPRANGLLQVALALSAYSVPFVTNGVWGYLHPLASRLGDTPETRSELLRVLRMVILLSSFGSIAVLSFPEVLIGLAYTADFAESATYFPTEFLGDYFYFFAFTVGVFFLATSKLRIYLIGWIAYYSMYLASVRFLLPHFGARAPTVGHCIASCVLAMVSILWLVTQVRIRLRDLTLFFVGGAVVLVAATMLYLGLFIWTRIAILAVPVVGYCVLAVRTEGAVRAGSR